LLALRVMLDTGLPLSELRTWMKRYPQLTRNLKVREKKPLASLPRTTAVLAALEAELAGRGVKTHASVVWLFVRAEGLSFKKNDPASGAGSAGHRPQAHPLEDPSGQD
jgi:transposase